MNRARALAGFVASEILLPAAIIFFCVLIAAQFLPLISRPVPADAGKAGIGTAAAAGSALKLEHRMEK